MAGGKVGTLWPEGGQMSGKNNTALHSAAESNDVETVRAELAKGVSTGVRNDGYLETPLHCAAIKGSAAAALELLRAGADLTATRSGGFTPLHMSETVEIAKMFIDHGADKTTKASVSPEPCSRPVWPPPAFARRPS
jgi:ankyrin repeat protein